MNEIKNIPYHQSNNNFLDIFFRVNSQFASIVRGVIQKDIPTSDRTIENRKAIGARQFFKA